MNIGTYTCFLWDSAFTYRNNAWPVKWIPRLLSDRIRRLHIGPLFAVARDEGSGGNDIGTHLLSRYAQHHLTWDSGCFLAKRAPGRLHVKTRSQASFTGRRLAETGGTTGRER